MPCRGGYCVEQALDLSSTCLPDARSTGADNRAATCEWIYRGESAL